MPKKTQYEREIEKILRPITFKSEEDWRRRLQKKMIIHIEGKKYEVLAPCGLGIDEYTSNVIMLRQLHKAFEFDIDMMMDCYDLASRMCRVEWNQERGSGHLLPLEKTQEERVPEGEVQEMIHEWLGVVVSDFEAIRATPDFGITVREETVDWMGLLEFLIWTEVEFRNQMRRVSLASPLSRAYHRGGQAFGIMAYVCRHDKLRWPVATRITAQGLIYRVVSTAAREIWKNEFEVSEVPTPSPEITRITLRDDVVIYPVDDDKDTKEES